MKNLKKKQKKLAYYDLFNSPFYEKERINLKGFPFLRFVQFPNADNSECSLFPNILLFI